MKLSKIFLLAVLPVIGLTIINTPINQVQQVQATDMACIEACAAIQATGAKACSLAWVNPIVYSGCMALVSGAFATCCFKCASSS